MVVHQIPETLWARIYKVCFRFRLNAKDNRSVPSLVQVVNLSRSYKNKITPLPPGDDDSCCPRKAVALEDPDRAPPSLKEVAVGPAPNGDQQTTEEFVRATRETLMEATIDGLVNKALISALFLNFNIPSIMSPPMEADMNDPTFLIFFLSAGFAIASGFYCILSGTFMATHAKATMVTQSMALVFSELMAPHIFWNHNIFMLQGLLTSVQVAASCVSYMDNSWALWLAVGACGLSLVGVSITKTAVNNTWDAALAAGGEGEEGEPDVAAAAIR